MSLGLQRLHHERQAHLIRVRNEKLEKLCRALQAERNQLQEQLRKVSFFILLKIIFHSIFLLEGGDGEGGEREGNWIS